MNAAAPTGPFHQGELRAQSLIGVSTSSAGIRNAMPDQHRAFFPLLRFVFVATTDDDGWPVGSIVTGQPGFITSSDPQSLQVDASAYWQEEIRSLLAPGKKIAMLGIDFNTRRRNRANGVVQSIDADGVHIGVHQSFGNCPKYIQARDVQDGPTSQHAASSQLLIQLDEEARRLIKNADTFFVATSSGSNTENGNGNDISHRGGKPGFIRIDGDRLTVPDFMGNKFFNTLGNMLVEPRAALLFIDFTTGDLLHLQGTTEVLWNSDETAELTGAERIWRFHFTHGWRRREAVPLRWTLREIAPTTEKTGTWQNV